MHNTPGLTYDADLAAGSQLWAEKMSKTGIMAHSTARDYGENLAAATGCEGSKFNLTVNPKATDLWYNEIDNPGYDFNNQGFSNGTGHFT